LGQKLITRSMSDDSTIVEKLSLHDLHRNAGLAQVQWLRRSWVRIIGVLSLRLFEIGESRISGLAILHVAWSGCSTGIPINPGLRRDEDAGIETGVRDDNVVVSSMLKIRCKMKSLFT
jgi:hypothetical protein